MRPRLTVVSDPDPPPEGPAAPPSIEQLFRSYARYVAAIGLRLLGRNDEVDDLVQDVFVEAHRGLAALRDPAAARGWLATIAVRRARWRLRRRRLLGVVGLGGGIDAVSRAIGPETHAVLAEVYQRLDELPANQRLAWTLRYLENEPLEQVAAMCECSLATAKRWIAAASRALEGES
jgi:RNA polymerase sigma-70 factor, ECF subfamily